MNILFLILCLVPHSLDISKDTPDTLWTVDFSPPSPTGWIAGPFWEYTGESVYLHLQCGGGSGTGYHLQEDSLISPDFVVPLTADSMVLVFDHYWWGHGFAYWGGEWSRSTSTLDMYNSSNPPYPIELWEIAAWCGSPPCNSPVDSLLAGGTYSIIDSDPVYILLNGISVGDTLSFAFRGLVEANVTMISAWAHIEWDIYTFSILNYPSVSLERSTWGMIKASF